MITRKIGGRRSAATVDDFRASVTYLGMYWGVDATNGGIVNLKDGIAPTLYNSIVVDTAQTLYGPSSLLCTAASQHEVAHADSANWDAGANGITIETYVRRNGVGLGDMIAHTDGGSQQAFEVAINASGELGVLWSANGSALLSNVTTSRGAIPDLTWTHVAVTYSVAASEVYCHIAGALTATITSITGLHTSTDSLFIGAGGANGAYRPFNGHLQGVRLTKDARYGAGSIVPPTFADLMASLMP